MNADLHLSFQDSVYDCLLNLYFEPSHFGIMKKFCIVIQSRYFVCCVLTSQAAELPLISPPDSSVAPTQPVLKARNCLFLSPLFFY